MKKVLLLIAFAILHATTFAQTSLTSYGIYSADSGDILFAIQLNGKKKISEKFYLTYVGYNNKNIGKAMVGVTYSPKSWVRFNIRAGVEKSNAGYRLGTSLWLGKDKYSLLLIADKGKGSKNYFYQAVGKYQLNKKIDLGINVWRFHGIGPHVGFRYKIFKLNSRIFLAPLYDFEFEQTRLVLGITIKI